MPLLHEVWEDIGGEVYSSFTFCLAGPQGEEARRDLSPQAKLIATIEADSHFEAMTQYYALMGWGEYRSDEPWNRQPYPREWYEK